MLNSNQSSSALASGPSQVVAAPPSWADQDDVAFGCECADPSLQMRAQEYRRKISSMMKPLSGAEIYKLPKAKGYFATRKYDGEFAMLFFDGQTMMSLNAGGTMDGTYLAKK